MTKTTERKRTDLVNYAPVIRLRVVKESEIIYKKPLRSPGEVAKFAASIFSGLDREYVYTVFVDSRGKINAVENISIGSLNQAVVEPREVFKGAIINNSAGVFLLHNHPSGDCSPSKEDIIVTERVRKAGQIVGIALKDHIIIGNDRYYSFEEGEVSFIDN